MQRPSAFGSLALVCALLAVSCADAAAERHDQPTPRQAAAVPGVGLTTEPAAITTSMVAGVAAESDPTTHEVGVESSTSEVRTSGWDEFPYLRYTVSVQPGTQRTTLTWSGRSVNTNDLALHVWNDKTDEWGPALAAAAPATPGGEIQLSAEVASESGTVEVLVIDSPRADRSFAETNSTPDRAFANADTYDFALQHITDTQYISRDDPGVYSEMTQWTADNADELKIDYSMHTGDLIQSWISPGRPDTQARKEFEVASESMNILEEAGIAHGVLPGNHDNIWNVAGKLVPGEHEKNHALYNEYFGPQRYRDQPYWGGSFTEEDNSAHYDLVDIAGAKFLMLFIGYNPPEKVMQWAERVLDDNPDRNVVIGTHYYLDELGEKKLMGFGDIGSSSGQQIWNRLVVPHESVFLVLSGHVDGQFAVVDENVGDSDRTVVQLLADYQYFEVDGERSTGFQRLLQFDVDGGSMAVTTHSPSLDAFDVENYDIKNRYGPEDGEFVTDFTLRADVPRAVMAN
ncbi:metallophosphoesterase [Rhodococcus sp. IEGM 1354]|uniref:metallophosphoesterase n=1 Tax=Rhodococcus sp. IEGM 1354 TaxID=3047088 RepID=UPI0024B76C6C|nr:metallophosphoesterase [Rhodococcus sp. IEGM 1354]MDI9929141.1 metallophosphoesterase [Rhodococcus sp. IEGM 1354]